ncbi:hypothetical protein O3M35_001042 [Rhynocoris fuscipes]|uniref:Uncharacterized protein n=1 Tax=Rhynocoris fuscipes TaxID=488301 RepID=A0AAW1DNU3_9HEMI
MRRVLCLFLFFIFSGGDNQQVYETDHEDFDDHPSELSKHPGFPGLSPSFESLVIHRDNFELAPAFLRQELMPPAAEDINQPEEAVNLNNINDQPLLHPPHPINEPDEAIYIHLPQPEADRQEPIPPPVEQNNQPEDAININNIQEQSLLQQPSRRRNESEGINLDDLSRDDL